MPVKSSTPRVKKALLPSPIITMTEPAVDVSLESKVVPAMAIIASVAMLMAFGSIIAAAAVNMSSMNNPPIPFEASQCTDGDNSNVTLDPTQIYPLAGFASAYGSSTAVKNFDPFTASKAICRDPAKYVGYIDQCYKDNYGPLGYISSEKVASCAPTDKRCRVREGFAYQMTSTNTAPAKWAISSWNYLCKNGCIAGACLKDQKCTDGTQSGQCSFNKPDYCSVDGQLISNPSICGCPNLMSVSGNQCIKKNISAPNYKCNYCQGYCRTNDSNTVSVCTTEDRYYEFSKDDIGPFGGMSCVSDAVCKNGILTARCVKGICITDLFKRPGGAPIEVNADYPHSVVYNKPFQYNLKITNIGKKNVEVRVNKVYQILHRSNSNPANEKLLNFDSTKVIPPNETVSYLIDIPAFSDLNLNFPFSTVTFDAEVSIDVTVDGVMVPFDAQKLAPINTYLVDFVSYPAQKCGKLTFNKGMGVCINDVLFPSSPACLNNSDCAGNGVCVNYVCSFSTVKAAPGALLNKTSQAGIVPIFIYQNSSWLNQQLVKRIPELTGLAQKATDWFNMERVYQSAKNNFNVNYGFYKSCSLSSSDYLNILKSCVDNYWGACEAKVLSSCGVDFTKYDIIAQTAYYEPGIDLTAIWAEQTRIGAAGVSGVNFGGHLIFGLQDAQGIKDIGVLIHETLHSFGEHDLYTYNFEPNSEYQERSCNLFRANWTGFEKNSHLCDFEAKIIGWKE